jgi:hypothetical protein
MGVEPATGGKVVHMGYSRQWLTGTLRRIGYSREADAAMQELPEEIEREELEAWADRHHISRDELTNRMGGSP